MKASKRIFLYGNSVILGTIGATLSRFSEYEVVTLKLPCENTQDHAAIKPDILVYDLDATQPQEVFSFLKIDPAMPLIGISSDVNLIRVWSLREFKELSIKDLLQVILSEAKDTPVESEGSEVHPFESMRSR